MISTSQDLERFVGILDEFENDDENSPGFNSLKKNAQEFLLKKLFKKLAPELAKEFTQAGEHFYHNNYKRYCGKKQDYINAIFPHIHKKISALMTIGNAKRSRHYGDYDGLMSCFNSVGMDFYDEVYNDLAEDIYFVNCSPDNSQNMCKSDGKGSPGVKESKEVSQAKKEKAFIMFGELKTNKEILENQIKKIKRKCGPVNGYQKTPKERKDCKELEIYLTGLQQRKQILESKIYELITRQPVVAQHDFAENYFEITGIEYKHEAIKDKADKFSDKVLESADNQDIKLVIKKLSKMYPKLTKAELAEFKKQVHVHKNHKRFKDKLEDLHKEIQNEKLYGVLELIQSDNSAVGSVCNDGDKFIAQMFSRRPAFMTEFKGSFSKNFPKRYDEIKDRFDMIMCRFESDTKQKLDQINSWDFTKNMAIMAAMAVIVPGSSLFGATGRAIITGGAIATDIGLTIHGFDVLNSNISAENNLAKICHADLNAKLAAEDALWEAGALLVAQVALTGGIVGVTNAGALKTAFKRSKEYFLKGKSAYSTGRAGVKFPERNIMSQLDDQKLVVELNEMQKLIKALENGASEMDPILLSRLKENLKTIKANVRKTIRNKYERPDLSDSDVDTIAHLESQGVQKGQIEKLLKKLVSNVVRNKKIIKVSNNMQLIKKFLFIIALLSHSFVSEGAAKDYALQDHCSLQSLVQGLRTEWAKFENGEVQFNQRVRIRTSYGEDIDGSFASYHPSGQDDNGNFFPCSYRNYGSWNNKNKTSLCKFSCF